MHGLAKQAGIKDNITLTALGIPVALATGKVLHSVYTDAEEQRDIRESLSDLSNRKDRMQAVRTVFEDQFKDFDIPEIDNEKTKVTVRRSMFPWKDKYTADVSLVDSEGNEIQDWLLGYGGTIYKDKNDQYTGYIEGIGTREDMQGKGIGRNVENRMVNAFEGLGASKVKLMPAFDGPVVWAKKYFNYELSPESKDTFLKAYKKYTEEKGIPFTDLGNRPSDYPVDFLQKLREYEPVWKSTYYEKPIQKAASLFGGGGGNMYGLAKMAEEQRPHVGDFALESAKDIGTDWAAAGALAGTTGLVGSEVLRALLEALASEDGFTFKKILDNLTPSSRQQVLDLLKRTGSHVGKPALIAGAAGTALGTAASYLPYAAHQPNQSQGTEKIAADEGDDVRTDLAAAGVGGGVGALVGGGLGTGLATGKIRPSSLLGDASKRFITPEALSNFEAPRYKLPLIGGLAAAGGLAGAGFGNSVADAIRWVGSEIEEPSTAIRNRLLAERGLEEEIDQIDESQLPSELQGALLGGALGAVPTAMGDLRKMKAGKYNPIATQLRNAANAQARQLVSPAVSRTLRVGTPLLGAGIGAFVGSRQNEEE